jgi:hypothetical protein
MKAEGFKRHEILSTIENELSIGQKKAEKALAIKNKLGYHTLRFAHPLLKNHAVIISNQDILEAVISFWLDTPLPKFDLINESGRVFVGSFTEKDRLD